MMVHRFARIDVVRSGHAARVVLVALGLAVSASVFAQTGPKAEDIKKFEDSNDLVGFTVVSYGVDSPAVGELQGCFKTYQAAQKKAADLMGLTINGRKIVSRVEISWDDGQCSNVTSMKQGDKPKTTGESFFSQPKALLARLTDAEGKVEHLYRDSRGNVTVGVGHKLSGRDAATRLGFLHKDDGKLATAREIEKEWDTVQALAANKPASFYEEKTTLKLSDDTIESLFRDDVAAAESALKRKFSGYDAFPLPAREALIDMSFNLGATGLVDKFPNFVAAVNARNWSKAAAESHRKGIGDERNDAVKQLFEDAATAKTTPLP